MIGAAALPFVGQRRLERAFADFRFHSELFDMGHRQGWALEGSKRTGLFGWGMRERRYFAVVGRVPFTLDDALPLLLEKAELDDLEPAI